MNKGRCLGRRNEKLMTGKLEQLFGIIAHIGNLPRVPF